MKTSYHNHTPRCHHASGSEEEYAAAAFAGGFSRFGFSDHAPLALREGYVSGCRMELSEVGDYRDAVLAERERYRGRMEVFLGFEMEYYPGVFEKTLDAYRGCPIDYIILGQHGYGAPEGEEGWLCSFDPCESAENLRAYTDRVIAGIRTGRYTLVAHPDCFRYVGSDEKTYRAEADRLISAAMEEDIPVELNLYGMADGRHYPNLLFWEEASRLGAKVILGRDAHKVERVASEEEEKRALEFAARLGLRVVEDTPLVDPFTGKR